MTRWQSLYWLSDEAQAGPPERFLIDRAYTLYDPFGRRPGPVFPHTMKLFLAPAVHGWVRILIEGSPEECEALAAFLSSDSLCLSAALDSRMAFLHAYQDGEVLDLETALLPHIQPGTEAALRHALEAESLDLPPPGDMTRIGDVALDDLPDDVRAMAEQVGDKQAGGLFRNLSQQLVRAVSRQDVHVLFEKRPDWHSQGGQFIRAVMACLLPADSAWRTPDFATLRSAYAMQSRPETLRLPADERVLQAVPNALDYIPVYGGKVAHDG